MQVNRSREPLAALDGETGVTGANDRTTPLSLHAPIARPFAAAGSSSTAFARQRHLGQDWRI